MESCPKCDSIFIQVDNISDNCYCLVKKCHHRWFQKLIRKDVENIYLRTSMHSEIIK